MQDGRGWVGGEGGSNGGIPGGLVDWLGRLPGKAVSGNSVGGENGRASSNIAAAGGMGSWGCEAALDKGPVAEDREGDEDGQVREMGVVMCGEGNGDDGDVRGREGDSSPFHPPSATQTRTASSLPFACVFRWYVIR
jgi:hypothetical protein